MWEINKDGQLAAGDALSPTERKYASPLPLQSVVYNRLHFFIDCFRLRHCTELVARLFNEKKTVLNKYKREAANCKLACIGGRQLWNLLELKAFDAINGFYFLFSSE